MRIKSLMLSAILGFSISTQAMAMSLSGTLDPDEFERLRSPIYTKEFVDVGGERILVVTEDYGSGLELRDAYVYRQDTDKVWVLVAYRRSNSSKIDVAIEKGRMKLRSKSGRELMAIPVSSFAQVFDGKEH